jgi:hypothetical protein
VGGIPCYRDPKHHSGGGKGIEIKALFVIPENPEHSACECLQIVNQNRILIFKAKTRARNEGG